MDFAKNCLRCNGELALRNGRWGLFLGCKNYPDCTYTKHVEPQTLLTTGPWINASSIGTAKFCINAAYLSEQKVKFSQRTKYKMQKGTRAHRIASRDSRCFIATYAFSAEHPIVNELRIWREHQLKPHWYGRYFIYLYYKLSPILIKKLGHQPLFKAFSRAFVSWFYNSIISKKG